MGSKCFVTFCINAPRDTHHPVLIIQAPFVIKREECYDSGTQISEAGTLEHFGGVLMITSMPQPHMTLEGKSLVSST